MNVLTLNLRSIYWDAINNNEKNEEYRLFNKYWKKRILNKRFDLICLCKGYPKKDDHSCRLLRKWNGYKIKNIKSDCWGGKLEKVFAIDVTQKVE